MTAEQKENLINFILIFVCGNLVIFDLIFILWVIFNIAPAHVY